MTDIVESTEQLPVAPLTPAQKVAFGLLLAAGASALLWVLAGFATLIWFAYAVPLAPEDLAHASWLGTATLALYFSGPLALGLAFASLIAGVGIGVARGSVMPIMTGLIMAVALFLTGHEAQVRVGILDDVIRIGCYVPESRECRMQLGLPTQDSPSMYAPQADGQFGAEHAEWYAKARAIRVSQDQEKLAMLSSVPPIMVLRAPLFLGRLEELKDKVFTQRAEVARMQAAATK